MDIEDRLKTHGLASALRGLRVRSGERLGAYQIEGLLGEGGMGVVYRGRRVDGQFDREVAIKLLPPLASDASRQRFQAETQLLARLDHPGIARLYDSGLVNGAPYLVLELVHGAPIDEVTNTRHLDVHGIVRLVLQLCSAVGYAHEHLVIHRDIKPSNVLITKDGSCKLLDFGIAKDIGAEANVTEERALTPDYASPEQLLGQPMTTRSDVYQIGMMLYRLCDGTQVNQTRSVEDAIKRAAALRDVAVDPRKVADKDLRAVIEKCLRANPADRYADASSLQADLKAWLAGFQVTARPTTQWQTLVKLVRRNPVGSGVVLGSLALLLGSTGLYIHSVNQSRAQAQAEAAKAQSVADYLGDVLAASSPLNAAIDKLDARSLLLLGIERAEVQLAEQPDVLLDVLQKIARILMHRSEWQSALTAAQKAQSVAAYQQANPLWLDSAVVQAQSLLALGQADEALRFAQEVYTSRRQSHDMDVVIPGISLAAYVYGNFPEHLQRSVELYEEAIELTVRHQGTHIEPMIPLVGNLGFSHWRLEQYTEARQHFRRAYDIAVQVHGPESTVAATSLLNMGGVHRKLGQPGTALQYYKQAFELRQERLPESYAAAYAGLTYSSNLVALESYATAEPIAERSLRQFETLSAPPHDLARGLENLARVHLAAGNIAEAERLLQRAQQQLPQFPPGNDEYPEILLALSELSRHQGWPQLALQRLDEAAHWWRENLGPMNSALASIERLRAHVLLTLDRPEQARESLQIAVNMWERMEMAENVYYADALAQLSQLTGCEQVWTSRLRPLARFVSDQLKPEHAIRQRVEAALLCGGAENAQ